MYHNVGADEAFFTVTPEMFLWQLQTVQQSKYVIQSLHEVLCGTIDRKSIVFTFDDAYENIYTHVFPLIKKHKVPITIFVPTARIGEEITNGQGFTNKIMNEIQIREMQDSGLVDFYSHGHAHIPTTDMSLVDFERDLEQSLQVIKNLGGKTDIFCYPKGKILEGTASILQSHGVMYGVGVGLGVYIQGDYAYNIKRLPIDKGVGKVRFAVYISPYLPMYLGFKNLIKKLIRS